MTCRRPALLVLAIVLTACAPRVDGPVERQRSVDRADAVHVQRQLAALPGAVSAHVVLHRPAVDPLSPADVAPRAPSISAVVLVDDATDIAAITRDASMLLSTVVPEASPSLVVAPVVHRAKLAKVGPFTVAASSRDALRATLAVTLAAIAGLAAWVALRARPLR